MLVKILVVIYFASIKNINKCGSHLLMGRFLSTKKTTVDPALPKNSYYIYRLRF